MRLVKEAGEKTKGAAVSAEQCLDSRSDLANERSSPPWGGLQESGHGFWLTLPALECLDWAAISLQLHSYRRAERGLWCIYPALFYTQLSTQESCCHETLDFLGSSILVTQSSNLFLEDGSRCPRQHFRWQCFSTAIQEHLVVSWLVTGKDGYFNRFTCFYL